MNKKIIVSREFLQDFNEYCALYDMSKDEIENLRNAVRSNMELTGKYISRHMLIHRWMLSTWGYIPSFELLQGYLYSKRIFIDCHLYGFYLLAGFCYDAS